MSDDGRGGDDRGRQAGRPGEIPARGWRDIALRVKRELTEDDISIVAGGVAFYAFLALFPALAALISLYGLLADPADVERQIDVLAAALPSQVQTTLREQMHALVGRSSQSLGLGVAVSLALALWSANKGTKALVTALNIAFDQEEDRGFFKRNGMTLLFTIGAVVFAAVAIGTVVALPALLGRLGLSGVGEFLVRWLRWPALAALVLLGLAVLYRYGPARAPAQWRWVTWGSAVATGLWLLGSAAFSYYVSNFGSYDRTYGSLGAIVILLTWFLLSAYVVLLGAELNAEMEHQTERDSTTGPPEPRGRRGAYHADTVGETP